MSDQPDKRTRKETRTVTNKVWADLQRKANRMLKEMTGEGSKNVSDMDISRAKEITELYEQWLKRNDGGIAKKTRVF